MNVTSHSDTPIVAADIIIVNANVHTMDAIQPATQAIAVLGNRIVATGTDKEVKKLAGPRTRIIDAKKRLVLPGFNDSHVHFLRLSIRVAQIDAGELKTPAEEMHMRVVRNPGATRSFLRIDDDASVAQAKLL